MRQFNINYKIAFYSLLVATLVLTVGFLVLHQYWWDRNQFERLYYLERNQSQIVKWIQQQAPATPAGK